MSLSSQLVRPEASRALSVESCYVGMRGERERASATREGETPRGGHRRPSFPFFHLLPLRHLCLCEIGMTENESDRGASTEKHERLQRREKTIRGGESIRRQPVAGIATRGTKKKERQRRTYCRTPSCLGSPFAMVSFNWPSGLQFTAGNVLAAAMENGDDGESRDGGE